MILFLFESINTTPAITHRARLRACSWIAKCCLLPLFGDSVFSFPRLVRKISSTNAGCFNCKLSSNRSMGDFYK